MSENTGLASSKNMGQILARFEKAGVAPPKRKKTEDRKEYFIRLSMALARVSDKGRGGLATSKTKKLASEAERLSDANRRQQ